MLDVLRYGSWTGHARRRRLNGDPAVLRSIILHGFLLAVGFSAIACLALRLDVSDPQKPIDATAAFAFVGLMVVAGIVWWSACRGIRSRATSRWGLWCILGFAVLFRVIVFHAPPILELDVYRYLWDGFVAANGVDPFRYAPTEAVEAIRFGDLETDPHLRKLAAAVERDPGATTILERVHFPDLPTVYPPAAQTMFRISEAMGSNASVERRLVTMKAHFLVCEAVTLAMVLLLLQRSGRPSTWIILPAWCPLAVVCVANQAHLDSLPAMWTFAAAVSASGPTLVAAALSGVLLALGGASKIYPLLLTPLFAVFIWRRAAQDRQTRSVVIFATALVATSLALWAPLLRGESRREGFAAFAGQWEMYDSFFAVIVGNLKPNTPEQPKPWYSIVPESIKRNVQSPDHTARGIWLAAVGVVAAFLTRRLWIDPTLESLLEKTFLLLVCFWALGPVCNPWYLMWMLPFLSFARNTGWLALFAVAPAMFLRFGMSSRFGANGEFWFDHVVVFALTAVWVVAVLLSRGRDQRLESTSTGTMAFSDPERNPSRSRLT